MKRLFRELILDGGYHNWITVPYIEDAKPTKAVDKLLSLGVREFGKVMMTLPNSRT